MIYIAFTFWLLVIVLIARSVHRAMGDMVGPRAIGMFLLPATLIARVCHIIGSLLTGTSVGNISLLDDGDSLDAPGQGHARPKIPVLGPVLVGLLPLAASSAAILLTVRTLGGAVASSVKYDYSHLSLPRSVAGLWQLPRDLITLLESVVKAIAGADLTDWKTWLLLYLLPCFAIRLAPLSGTLRGTLGAIILTGPALAALASLIPTIESHVLGAVPAIAFTLSTLILLAVVTASVRGGTGLIRLLRSDA